MGKAAYDLPLLQFLGRLALPGQLDEGSEILPALLFFDVDTTGEAHGPRGEKAGLVAVLRRHNTVGSHEDGAIEGFKFFLLFPPGIAIVACKMPVLLELGIVMGRQHFPMGVDLHPGALRLLQQHFQITQVMA